MSDITTTSSIEDIDIPAREPSIKLADVLAALGTVAFHGARLAMKGVASGTRLAFTGIKTGAKAIQNRRLHANEIDAVVNSSTSAAEAIGRLAETPGFELPKNSTEPLKVELMTLVANNDKFGVATLAKQLRRASQNRLQTSLITLAAESCREIGFDLVTLRPNHGILTARSSKSPGVLTIEVARSGDGGVKLHSDAAEFHGSACVETQNSFFARLAAKGVRSKIETRRRKDRSPVFDGGSLRQVRRIGR